MAGIAPGRLVFLDESGIDARPPRTHARAPRGERAVGHAPWKRRRLTLIGALGLGGTVALMAVAAATDATVFVVFIEGVLAPALGRRPEAVLVLDNLAVRKTPAVRAALDRARISYRHLPSYSPDFNPMEPCWAKLKAHFRTRAARSLEALEAELPSALRTITPGNAQRWFRHCRYLPEGCANRCNPAGSTRASRSAQGDFPDDNLSEMSRSRTILPLPDGDDLQLPIRQRTLEIDCFFRRRREPAVDLLRRSQQHRHGLRMDGHHLGVRVRGQEGVDGPP